MDNGCWFLRFPKNCFSVQGNDFPFEHESCSKAKVIYILMRPLLNIQRGDKNRPGDILSGEMDAFSPPCPSCAFRLLRFFFGLIDSPSFWSSSSLPRFLVLWFGVEESCLDCLFVDCDGWGLGCFFLTLRGFGPLAFLCGFDRGASMGCGVGNVSFSSTGTFSASSTIWRWIKLGQYTESEDQPLPWFGVFLRSVAQGSWPTWWYVRVVPLAFCAAWHVVLETERLLHSGAYSYHLRHQEWDICPCLN